MKNIFSLACDTRSVLVTVEADTPEQAASELQSVLDSPGPREIRHVASVERVVIDLVAKEEAWSNELGGES